MWPWAE
jgi:hypothetical protein